MRPQDVVAEAWGALRAQRLRTALSALGIVVGVSAVIAALAIGEGARREALAEIGGLGIDNLYVRAVPPEASPGQTRSVAPALSTADVAALAHAVPAVEAVSGARTARVMLSAGGQSVDTNLAGIHPEWRAVASLGILRGRWFSETDLTERRRVAVLDTGLGRSLFGPADPLGRAVWAGRDRYTVVGLLDDRAAESSRRRPVPFVETSHALLVPLTAMDQRLGADDAGDRVEVIGIRVAGAGAVETAAPIVRRVLQRRHRDGAWEVVVPRALLDARLRAQRTFTLVLVAIGALALAVAGAGIMNILLASVAERTHEIGVRRAVGARARDVVAQFATEAALLCLIGASAGIPAGAGLAAAIALVAGWPVALSGLSIVLALLLALVVGLTAGVHPARVAARLDPVDALRAG